MLERKKKMYCKKCGSKIADGSVFCSKCGTKTAAENVGAEETEITEKPLSDKAKKAKISRKVFFISGSVLLVSILLAFILDFSPIFAATSGMSFMVALFSFVAMWGYTEDIPDSEKTKGQKILIAILSIIGSILAIFFFWYRFLGGQEVIMNLIKKSMK